MSNSRSFRRTVKAGRHVRPSGREAEPAKREPWNKGIALTTTPTIGTVRRWVKACVAEGTVEQVGVEHTGKPGRPAVLWGLTEKGREKTKGRASPEVRRLEWEQMRRRENAWAKRKMQRGAQRLNALQQEAARAGRNLNAAEAAAEDARVKLEQARAELLMMEILFRATRALLDAGGDPSVLLPEEMGTLTETGCAVMEGGRLVLADDWLEAFQQIRDSEPAASGRRSS